MKRSLQVIHLPNKEQQMHTITLAMTHYVFVCIRVHVCIFPPKTPQQITCRRRWTQTPPSLQQHSRSNKWPLHHTHLHWTYTRALKKRMHPKVRRTLKVIRHFIYIYDYKATIVFIYHFHPMPWWRDGLRTTYCFMMAEKMCFMMNFLVLLLNITEPCFKKLDLEFPKY